MNVGNVLAMLRELCHGSHIALNLLKQENSMKKSIKTKRLQAGWDDIYLMKVLGVKAI